MKVINRIKKYDEFQKVINYGELRKFTFINCYILKNGLGYSRFGISVPKKAGNAVIRNRIKRQLRSCIAMNCDYKKSIDYIVIVRKDFDTNNFSEISSEISELVR